MKINAKSIGKTRKILLNKFR